MELSISSDGASTSHQTRAEQADSYHNPHRKASGGEEVGAFVEEMINSRVRQAMLKALKLTGAHNRKLSTKIAVLAAKMTQSQFSVTDALKLVEIMEGENSEEPHFLKALSPTAVRINKLAGVEYLVWLREYIKIMKGDEIKVGEPVQEPPTFGATQTSREPDLLASEICLILRTHSLTRA